MIDDRYTSLMMVTTPEDHAIHMVTRPLNAARATTGLNSVTQTDNAAASPHLVWVNNVGKKEPLHRKKSPPSPVRRCGNDRFHNNTCHGFHSWQKETRTTSRISVSEWVISKFNGTSTPKGSYSARISVSKGAESDSGSGTWHGGINQTTPPMKFQINVS